MPCISERLTECVTGRKCDRLVCDNVWLLIGNGRLVTLELLFSAFLPDETEGRLLHAPHPIAETATPVEPVIEMVIHRRASDSDAAPTTTLSAAAVQTEHRPASTISSSS